MEVFKFKTNINSEVSLSSVAPLLDKVECIEYWVIDSTHQDKILTVKGREIDGNEIENVVKAAGFAIERKSQVLYSAMF